MKGFLRQLSISIPPYSMVLQKV